MTQKLPQIYTAKQATFPIRVRKITVQICGNFWVTQQVEEEVIEIERENKQKNWQRRSTKGINSFRDKQYDTINM